MKCRTKRNYKNIYCKKIINKITRDDYLFNGEYTIDPYQNCEFACAYCDSSFEKNIYIKLNAVGKLKEEIKKLDRGKIIIGSVHDPYQPVEEKTCLTQNILKTIKKYNFPCNILTKSDLILRDLDLLSSINNCTVTVSIISNSQNVADIFEENIPSTNQRFKVIETLSENNINCGVAMMPILPYITDSESLSILKSSKEAGADFFVYKHLELKGDLRGFYFEKIKNFFPEKIKLYEKLYMDSFQPDEKYLKPLKRKVELQKKKYF